MPAIRVLRAQYQYPGSFYAEPGLSLSIDNEYPKFSYLVENQEDDRWFCVEIVESWKTRVTDDDGNTFLINTPDTYSKVLRRIFVGEFYTLEDVAREEGEDSILYRNLKNNDFVGGVKSRVGNWQGVNEDDTVVDTAGRVRYARA